MNAVILFGIGSPILADVEESLYRAGWSVAGGIQNRPGPSHMSANAPVLLPEQITPYLMRLPFLVPLFTPANRHQAALEAAQSGLEQPFSLIDPSATVPRRFNPGPGSYVNAGCSIGAGGQFGRFIFINRGASLGHHCRLGDFVSIGPGVTVAGQVTIGRGTMVGTGATILPSLHVGENAVIGAGSVVTRDVPSGCLVVGNPARIVRTDIGGYKGLRVA
jgi:sugar O-acyltransferase (sialic acid O-acetyltransferase NeuD family)